MSVEFVKQQLQNLKTNKAAGLDKISARLLKDGSDVIACAKIMSAAQAADVIATVLQKIIKLSIEQQCVPNS